MEDGNAKWIPSEALAKEGYLIASADFAVLLVSLASPVGLHILNKSIASVQLINWLFQSLSPAFYYKTY